MNDAVAPGTKAVLVHINFNNSRFDEELDEFIQLVNSSGLVPYEIVKGQSDQPNARFFIGTGKVQEIAGFVLGHDASLVLFNHELSPAQERNLEKELKCRVLDRAGLILDIFAQRARSYEGKLQVELAQLQHISTRARQGMVAFGTPEGWNWTARSWGNPARN